MNIVITATQSDTDLLAALTAGTAQVHSEREDGTLRRRHFLTGKDLEHALWVRLQREGQEADEAEGIVAVAPRSMASIARELAITEELEASDQGDMEAMLVGASEQE
jgi:hypothetical protein